MRQLRKVLTMVAFGGNTKLRYGFTVNVIKEVDVDFGQLTKTFLLSKDMDVFSKLIKDSNNVIDNIYYFKIFKFLTESKSQIKHFESFYNQVNMTVQKKSDNLRMLLANCKVHIAKIHEEYENYYDALGCLDEALQMLEESLIPPVLLYYQIYRYYGFLKYKTNEKKQVEEILIQSVTMIDKFIEQSDDYVQNNNNSKNQAKAYCILAELNAQNKRKQWIKKCMECWEEFEGDKFELKEYADSIVAKAQFDAESDKQKAEEFLTVSIYQFKDKELKEYLKNKKSEILGQK